jgi:hypothetical protein
MDSTVSGARRSGVITDAVLLALFVSPPPLTVAVLTRLAGAFAATFTATVIGG